MYTCLWWQEAITQLVYSSTKERNVVFQPTTIFLILKIYSKWNFHSLVWSFDHAHACLIRFLDLTPLHTERLKGKGVAKIPRFVAGHQIIQYNKTLLVWLDNNVLCDASFTDCVVWWWPVWPTSQTNKLLNLRSLFWWGKRLQHLFPWLISSFDVYE